MSNINILLFRISKRLYGLDLELIHKIIRIVELVTLPDSNESVLGVINYQGKIIPVYNIRKIIGIQDKAYELSDKIIILQHADKLSAIIVDDVDEMLSVESSKFIDSSEVNIDVSLVKGLIKYADEIVVLFNKQNLLNKFNP